MMLDIVRLTLFPTLMAFAAASDLLTMTISNRISLLLVAGFVVLAALSEVREKKGRMSCGRPPRCVPPWVQSNCLARIETTPRLAMMT